MTTLAGTAYRRTVGVAGEPTVGRATARPDRCSAGPADRRWWHVTLVDDAASWTMDVRVDEISGVRFVRQLHPTDHYGSQMTRQGRCDTLRLEERAGGPAPE